MSDCCTSLVEAPVHDSHYGPLEHKPWAAKNSQFVGETLFTFVLPRFVLVSRPLYQLFGLIRHLVCSLHQHHIANRCVAICSAEVPSFRQEQLVCAFAANALVLIDPNNLLIVGLFSCSGWHRNQWRVRFGHFQHHLGDRCVRPGRWAHLHIKLVLSLERLLLLSHQHCHPPGSNRWRKNILVSIRSPH